MAVITGNVFCDANECDAFLAWSADRHADTYGELVEAIQGLGLLRS